MCTFIPIRKMSQWSKLSKLNKQSSLLSLSLITKISLHKTLLCWQIPEHYACDSKQRKRKRRKKVLSEDHMPETIGQLYSIHPTQIEL